MSAPAFKVGDEVVVRWMDTVGCATVVAVLASNGQKRREPYYRVDIGSHSHPWYSESEIKAVGKESA